MTVPRPPTSERLMPRAPRQKPAGLEKPHWRTTGPITTSLSSTGPSLDTLDAFASAAAAFSVKRAVVKSKNSGVGAGLPERHTFGRAMGMAASVHVAAAAAAGAFQANDLAAELGDARGAKSAATFSGIPRAAYPASRIPVRLGKAAEPAPSSTAARRHSLARSTVSLDAPANPANAANAANAGKLQSERHKVNIVFRESNGQAAERTTALHRRTEDDRERENERDRARKEGTRAKKAHLDTAARPSLQTRTAPASRPSTFNANATGNARLHLNSTANATGNATGNAGAKVLSAKTQSQLRIEPQPRTLSQRPTTQVRSAGARGWSQNPPTHEELVARYVFLLSRSSPTSASLATTLAEVQHLILAHGIPDHSFSLDENGQPSGHDTLRARVWALLCDVKQVDAALYIRLNARGFVKELMGKIDNDVHRTMNGDAEYQARVPLAVLTRILHAFVWHARGKPSARSSNQNSPPVQKQSGTTKLASNLATCRA